MRSQSGIADANSSEGLALDHTRSFPDRDPVERAIHRVIAAAVLENARVAIGAHRPRVRDRSSGNRLHHRANGRADPDPVPAGRGVVGIHETAKPVEKRSVHRPIQTAYIGRTDRARRQRPRSAAPARSSTLGLERRDQVVQSGLALLQLRETRLRALGVSLHSHAVLRLLLLQVRETRSLPLFLRTILGHAVLQPHQLHLLRFDLVVQLVETVHQALVSQGQQVQVLVPRDELSHRLRGEQHFGGIERTPLVDLDQPPLQHRALHPRLALRLLEVAGGRLHFVRDCDELLVEGLHHARGRVVLLVEKIHFVADFVCGVLEPAHFFLELVALGADAGKLIALRVHPRFGALGLLSWQVRTKQQRAERDRVRRAAQIRRRCLPTETRLPSTPITAPPTTPRKTSWRSKKIVSMKYSLTTLFATQTNISASSPPSTPFTSPSIRKGRRMNMSVAPTRRMIEISFARARTVIRMVAPMMMTATAANATPSAIPATVAMLRRR